jgi:hypothetical protein
VLRARVPEAATYLHCDALPGKRDVYSSANASERSHMDAVPEPELEELPTNGELGSGVRPSLALHPSSDRW